MILNVPYHGSKQDFYCSEASAQMFLEYYGYELDQENIHQYADKFEDLLPFLNKYVKVVELTPSKPLFTESINQGNPLLLRIHNNLLHTMVVIGYTTTDFIVHDPDSGANVYINQDKLLNISEKAISKESKTMSEIEEVEKKLADLKCQREALEKEEEKPLFDGDSVLSKIMDMDYETHALICQNLKKIGHSDDDASNEADTLVNRYRDMEKELIRLLGLTEKLQEMIGHG